jgi:hypothetical protein
MGPWHGNYPDILPQAASTYSFATLAWLSMQAVPLIVWPTFIASLLTPNYQHANRT